MWIQRSWSAWMATPDSAGQALVGLSLVPGGGVAGEIADARWGGAVQQVDVSVGQQVPDPMVPLLVFLQRERQLRFRRPAGEQQLSPVAASAR
jgi:hypothetical protein